MKCLSLTSLKKTADAALQCLTIIVLFPSPTTQTTANGAVSTASASATTGASAMKASMVGGAPDVGTQVFVFCISDFTSQLESVPIFFFDSLSIFCFISIYTNACL